MGHLREPRSYFAGRRTSCQPVAAREDDPSCASRERGNERIVARPRAKDDFAIDETEGILFALAQAVEQRDLQTAGHCERLAFISVALGMAMGLDRAKLLTLHRGGYLHDVGKVGIPDSIMFKPTLLTDRK